MTASDAALSDLRALISREPSAPDDKPDTIGWLQRLCRSAARSLPASGVGVSVMSDEGDHVTAAASDPRSVLVEELQFTLGEGPCLDAYSSGRPVLSADLTEDTRRWPGYGPAAHEHGIRAVFAFPLQVGAARLGALDVYRDEAGSLSPRVVSQALTFADLALQSLLDAQKRTEDHTTTSAIDDSMDNRFVVYQAQGMVMIQLGVSMREAMARLRAYAFARDRRVGDVAEDIIARRLTLEDDGS